MKKVLILASVASMIDQFNMPFINLLMGMGYTVDVACNFVNGNTCSDEKVAMLIKELDKLGVGHYQIDFSRSILNLKDNVAAYRQVKKLVSETNYEFIHCHSPIGGVVGRIAGKISKTKVIYTAHGYHFYKGAPILNWMLYFPIEWICSFMTDTLITINKEDFELAKKHMHAKKIEYVPGVGIDLSRFGTAKIDVNEKRKELGVPEDATLFLSVGELNENKNHETVIKAIDGMDVYYIVAGIGNKLDELQEIIDKQNMTDRIKLLGFRDDVCELYNTSDIFVFPSYREGLPVALMEAMASGLPCVASKIRGNTDLIDENDGILFNPHSVEDCRKAIENIIKSDMKKMGMNNKAVIKRFSTEEVVEKMKNIYG